MNATGNDNNSGNNNGDGNDDGNRRKKFDEFTDAEIAVIIDGAKEVIRDLCWQVIDRKILKETGAMTPAVFTTLMILFIEKMCEDYADIYRNRHSININRSLLTCIKKAVEAYIDEYMKGTEDRKGGWSDLR